MRRHHVTERSIGLRLRRAAVALAAIVAVIVPAASAGAIGDPGGFFDGQITYSSITNCVSIIQGAPYSEFGAGAYVGAYADPDEAPPVPGVGQTFYMHVVVYGLGNSCAGQYFVPAIDLPAGVSFDTSAPILCFTKYGQATGPTDCPQWANTAPSTYGGDLMYLSSDTAHARTWPLPTGGFWEFRFPVTAASQQTSTQLGSYVKMFDGNGSPTLHSTSYLYVFGSSASPALLYDSPSTLAGPFLPNSSMPTNAGIYSVANYFTYGAGGTGTLQIGTSPGSYPQQVAFALPAGTNSWQVSTDWNEPGIAALVPGTTYYWRATFDPDGSAGIVYGAQQQFTMPPAGTCGGQVITVALGLGQQPTEGADVIIGTPAAETISGGGGNDIICGSGGNDTLIGGAGNDQLFGDGGRDTASYADAGSAVAVVLGPGSQNTGGAGIDTLSSIENLTGSPFADTLTGSGGANSLVGGSGNDTLKGGKGNDILDGGAGNDTLDGGTGTDRASYAGSAGGVRVNLAVAVAQNTSAAGSDTLVSIEDLTGSPFNDRLTGNGGANKIIGGSGRDILKGGSGNDTLDGGSGNDNLDGGAGNDNLKGGKGVDTVTYAGSNPGVTVDLALTSAQNTVGSGTDTLSLIENLTGSGRNDVLRGTKGPNVLNGAAGTDVCDGRGGVDVAKSCETKVGIP
ncbi:MAG: calcium-binding protein [Actinobacteria bacterium]|nr:calcium-binding protein [Actinomycetota bacterium]